MMNVQLLKDDAIPPKRAYYTDAGFDVFSNQNITILAGQRTTVLTGIAISIQSQDAFYIRVAPRSGLAANHGIDVLAGVIDSSYRGELKIVLYNTSNQDYKISKNDKIAQLIPTKLLHVTSVECVDSIDKTDRQGLGFGSSGY